MFRTDRELHILAVEVLFSVCCLYIDNVGIGTRAIAVIGSQAIIVVRIVGQSGNAVASRIAYVQILITRYITAK